MSKLGMTLGVGSVAMLAAAALVSCAPPPSAKPVPDFSSNGAAWAAPGGGDAEFIPVPNSPPIVGNDPAHPYISNETFRRTGQQPTYRIADLTNPNLTPWAKEIMKKDIDEVLAGKIAYEGVQACTPSGVPAYLSATGPYFFIQTPQKVLLYEPDEGQARRIHLNAGHSANVKPSWYGESVGHYEGDTLVVDTIGLNAKTVVDNYRTPHSEKLHVVERFRLIDGGKTMEILTIVEDPDTYYQPWQAKLRFERVEETRGEEICREGNFTLFSYGIPIDETPDF
jgi:hypothetical protein